MTQAYSNPKRESDPHALPDVEVFYRRANAIYRDGEYQVEPTGWYWWSCFPGCLPDSEPIGPFNTEAAALENAREGLNNDTTE